LPWRACGRAGAGGDGHCSPASFAWPQLMCLLASGLGLLMIDQAPGSCSALGETYLCVPAVWTSARLPWPHKQCIPLHLQWSRLGGSGPPLSSSCEVAHLRCCLQEAQRHHQLPDSLLPEDRLHFVCTLSMYLLSGDVLPPAMPAMWDHLRVATMNCMRFGDTIVCFTRQALVDSHNKLLESAKELECRGLHCQCTCNLHNHICGCTGVWRKRWFFG